MNLLFVSGYNYTVRVENFEVFLISRFSWVADDTKIRHVSGGINTQIRHNLAERQLCSIKKNRPGNEASVRTAVMLCNDLYQSPPQTFYSSDSISMGKSKEARREGRSRTPPQTISPRTLLVCSVALAVVAALALLCLRVPARGRVNDGT